MSNDGKDSDSYIINLSYSPQEIRIDDWFDIDRPYYRKEIKFIMTVTKAQLL